MFLLSNGRQWRIHYWLLNKQTILEDAEFGIESPKKQVVPSKPYTHHCNSVYSYLPAELWVMRKKLPGA